MSNFGKNVALWIVIALLVIALFNLFQGNSQKQVDMELAYSEFLSRVENNAVNDVTIQGDKVTGHLTDGRSFRTVAPPNANLSQRLEGTGIRIAAKPDDSGEPGLFSSLIYWLPLLLLIGVWIFFMRQMQGGGRGGAMGFGKSKAKLMTESKAKVTFKDVAGIDEAKGELEEIVEYLRDPQRFQRLGGEIPKGMLLVGPPGTGKTLLAKAIAGEANVPFFSISGSDFVEMFVGVGASRVRDMFEQGKKNAPCLIFIDELDAVGRHRGAGMGGGNDEREQTLNQLLVEMDGFETNEGVILIAATNRPDVLDPALMRPGRFDRQIVVPNPDIVGREQILKVHTRKLPLGEDVDLRVISRGTPGFSGADLHNLANEAALLAARRGKRVVAMQEFEDAKDKVMMGAERRSMVLTEDEKKLTAYHEGGHAIVAAHQPASDPIHKATIIPRGRALGVVMRLPERDRLSVARNKLEADLTVAMGGRVAEEIVFGPERVTTGASADIKQATDMARKMVTEYGMSEKLGMRAYGGDDEEVFVGAQITQQKSLSDQTVQAVDEEINRIINESYERAERILHEHTDQLERVAQALLEYETLSGDEIHKLIRGEEIHREEPSDEKPSDEDAGKAKKRRRGSVPKSGRGVSPEPQPGS